MKILRKYTRKQLNNDHLLSVFSKLLQLEFQGKALSIDAVIKKVKDIDSIFIQRTL